jgi:hypothetical protein
MRCDVWDFVGSSSKKSRLSQGMLWWPVVENLNLTVGLMDWISGTVERRDLHLQRARQKKEHSDHTVRGTVLS